MYKNNSGELVFKSKEEYHKFSEDFEKEYEISKKGIKCNGIRIHMNKELDFLIVKRGKC